MPTVIAAAPTSYPISLSELKDHLRETSSANDSILYQLIKEATDYIEGYTWRKIVTQSWKYYIDYFTDCIEIPFGQLQSATIQYYDADNALQTLSTSVYDVDTYSDPGFIRIKDGQSWPTIYSKANAVIISFTCGYASIPESIKTAVKLKAELLNGNLFDNEVIYLERAIISSVYPYRLCI